MPIIRAPAAPTRQFNPGPRLGLGNYALYDYGNTNTLWYVPFTHNMVPLYTGSNWQPFEMSASISKTNTGLSANTNYDVFVYDNAGTLTLDLVAWSGNTSRATALSQQDGVWVKNAAPTRLWVGTVRTDASTYFQDQLGDSTNGGWRYVWNAYNRRKRVLRKYETSDSWTYTTATWRQTRGSSTNQVSFVVGLDTGYDAEPVSARVWMRFSNGSTVNNAVGVGLDSTSSNSATVFGMANVAGGNAGAYAEYVGAVSAGYHYLAQLEYSQAAGTTTWYGDAGLSQQQTGLIAEVWA